MAASPVCAGASNRINVDLKFRGMYALRHGLVRVFVDVNGELHRVTCFAHEFPNEERGLEWLRQVIEEKGPSPTRTY